jgi:dTDP-4-amino-4,6-dideoxygalactose transaminase
MCGREQEYINEAIETNWVAPLGPNVDKFEIGLSNYLNARSVVSLNSGTAALHLALRALNVQKGDVVICQSFTFAASAFPILYCNAEPVFIDSESETWNMDPDLLLMAIKDQKAKGKKIAAIIIVHLYGMPAKMKEILAIASQYQIPIIEDAAEALGSKYENRACGNIGNIGVLSFNGNKIITTSGGGALVSNDELIIQKVRHVSAQAKEPAPYYLHKEMGFNYRLSNICAGIGRGQLEVLSERVEKRRMIFHQYHNELSKIKGLMFVAEPAGCFSNRWLTTILFDTAVFEPGTNGRVRIALEKLNIESRPLWKPLHQQPVFSNHESYVNGVSDELFANGLCLPSGSSMTKEQIDLVINEITRILK